MAPSTSEHDILHNKLNVLLAKNQRFVSSWPSLKREREEEPPNPKSMDEIEKEEQEIFTPTPELLGLGARLPQDGEVRREELSSNDKLRNQLLGKDWAKKQKKGMKDTVKSGFEGSLVGSKPRPSSTKPLAKDDSGDEESRSSVGKSRQRNTKHCAKPELELDMDPTAEARDLYHKNHHKSRLQKVSGNYLDEVLANRSLQKRKKSKKKTP